MDWEWAYWFRLLNCLLAAIIVGLCFIKVNTEYPDNPRNTRVAGLGLICLAIVWGSLARRTEDFNPRILVYTAGLTLSLLGMRRMASGEKPQLKRFKRFKK